ncbi:von Willebrand factor A-like domain-containing protein [Desulfonema limicola]|uniref:von Willebrand factor A-like domain-containing protein n=1 Tax=Desulfonema limicola TaxID=45656 RepID=A0A975GEG7_9BACT|nr:VIT domain-containing protein [Desulfonema limicola]QTA78104.1 von Willebrand factor A-like domain-containing protein [Desulfonema limicola]
MKYIKVVFILFIFFCLIPGFNSIAVETVPENDEKTLSPYFLVKSDDPDTDQLPLKSTSADVNIAGVIADVRVTQVYKNEGRSPLEAVYVFPGSTRAAVYGMKMTIGERTLTAKIQERQKARQEYEQARDEGKSASLLEQQRPNVFQMNVANIMPKDEIRVELSYTELLIPDEGVYEFVYPTVVGPRYSNMPESQAPKSEQWVKNPYLHEGESPNYTFDMKVKISAGMPIEEIVCTSHKTDIEFESSETAFVLPDKSEKYGGNRDFILKYKLAGSNIQSGLLLYEGDRENFFLLMMQPPKRVLPENIPPREYMFIVDVSGSMRGFPLDISKAVLKDLIGNLRPDDRFNVLLFSGGSNLLAEKSMPANAENIQRAIQVIDNQQGGGGTELLPALNHALGMEDNEKGSRTLVIVTDGFVRVEKEAFDLIRNRLGEANMFTFGIGSSVNRYLLEGMARAGMGEPFIITKPEQGPAKADKFRQYIQSPVLTSVKVDFKGFKAYDIEPPAIPDVFAQRPVIIFGKWKGEPKGIVRLKGITGTKEYSDEISVTRFKPSKTNSGLRYLWARHRIALLSDYNTAAPDSETEKEITNLGLEYNLLTAYTSFVAIDNQIRNKDGKTITIKQPLPLPQGVSDYAVGSRGLMSKRMFPAMAAKPMVSPSLLAAPAPEKYPSGRLKQEPAKPVIRVRVNPDKMTIKGSFSREYLQKIFESHINKIETCFNSSGLKIINPGQTNAQLKISISIDGSVVSSELLIPGIKDKQLELCITELVKKWQFEKPVDGKPVFVIYSLVLKKGS